MSFKSKEKRKLGKLDHFLKRMKSDGGGVGKEANEEGYEGAGGSVENSDNSPTTCTPACLLKHKIECLPDFKLDIGNYIIEAETAMKVLNLDDFTKYELLVNHWKPP
ncbi:hypothetical protein JTB14_034639 [Gonioctena quinquepunctata]|nr:hypothetical protein JTB14_034639 [Gonioctena quinquepunctata]